MNEFMLPDIICISTQYWNDFWFRKQHFMSRFAQLGHRVLYVQPSFSMVRSNDKPQIARNRWLRPLVEKVSEKIYLFSPPRLLPKPNIPMISYLNYKWIGMSVKRESIKMGMKNPILWVYRPEFSVAIESIPHTRLVFDLADDLAAYNKDSFRYKYISQCIDKLAVNADLMVVTSPILLDMYRGKTKQCELVPNGFDEMLFDGKPKAAPPDFTSIPHPIVGFVGVLFSFLDYELLYEAAKTLSDISFVFVGPTEGSGQTGVALLKTLSNTYFLGSKPKENIPAYISNFDICINPFKVDNVSRSVSPLKVYEYLACGKPFISTPMEGLTREVGKKWVQFVERSEFTASIKETLAKTPVKINDECVKAAQTFSWTSRFTKLRQHVDEILIVR